MPTKRDFAGGRCFSSDVFRNLSVVIEGSCSPFTAACTWSQQVPLLPLFLALPQGQVKLFWQIGLLVPCTMGASSSTRILGWKGPPGELMFLNKMHLGFMAAEAVLSFLCNTVHWRVWKKNSDRSLMTYFKAWSTKCQFREITGERNIN